MVVSKHGLFIGKSYECGGLFRFFLADYCNKSVNHICGNMDDDARFSTHVYVILILVACLGFPA